MTTPPTTEERIAHIEGAFEQTSARLGMLEQDLRAFRNETNAQFQTIRTEMYAEIETLRTQVEALRSETDARFAALEARTGQVESRLERLETRMDALEARLDRIESRLDRIESRIDRLYYIQLGLIGAIVVATAVAAVARFFT